MKALILCGGVGDRFRPLRQEKFLMEFLGRPLLLHILDQLRSAGIERFILVSNCTNEEPLRRTLEVDPGGIPCDVVLQPGHSGMAGAVEAAANHLDGPVLVVSSNDVVESEAYRKVVAAARSEQCDSALLSCRVQHYFPGGYLVVDPNLRIEHIVEKPGEGSEPSDLVNVVVHYHRDPSLLLHALSRARTAQDDRYEIALEQLMREGRNMLAVPYDGHWSPMKYPWDVFPVMRHFLSSLQSGVASSARVHPSAVMEGKVVLADGVRVLEHAVVRGPAYIGERAIIGNNVLIRGGCHIGAGSVVGFATEVKHAYIGRDCWFHSNYIGDSIIDDRCSLGSGAVTANLRFDEGVIGVQVNDTRVLTGMDKLGVIMGAGSQVGINASLMPGVLVGPGAVVGPHVCLAGNLASGQRALSRAEYAVDNGGAAPTMAARQAMKDRLRSD